VRNGAGREVAGWGSLDTPAADYCGKFFEAFEEGGELGKREGVGAVGEGFGGVVVGFEEDAVDACGYTGAGERFDEFGLAAAGVALATGDLDGVRNVEDDRIAQPLQNGERAHVDDEILIAEAGAAFGEDNVFVAGAGDFFDDVGHVPWGDELGFLDVDDAAGFGRGEEEIGLAREKGRDLQDVADFGGRLRLGGLVNVSEDGEVQVGFDFGEDAQAFLEAGTAKGFYRGAVGFVIGGFEDVGNAGVGGNFGYSFRHFARMRFAFDDAGAGDEKERVADAEAQRAERNVVSGDHRRYRR
jgi:hypothetical protein